MKSILENKEENKEIEEHFFLNKEKINQYARTVGLNTFEELYYFPKFLQIETIALCNARCVMCPVNDIEREKRTMDSGLFTKLVSELSDYADWVERVTIQLNGEPLLDKGLEGKIKSLKNIGIKMVSFTSNGSLMDKDRAESILLSGINNIDFSVDGASKETYEAIRIRLKYDEVFANIKNFIEMRNKINPDVSVRLRMTVMDNNEEEFEDLVHYWEGIFGSNDRVYGKLISSWANWLEGYTLPEGHDRDKLNKTPCITLWGSFPILSDGRVPICCTDFNAKVCLGNVYESTIQEIWQGYILSNLREQHLIKGRGSVSTCKDCFVWEDTTKVI